MSEDLIKRSDAIDAVMNTEPVFAVDSLEPYQKTKDVVEALEAIPSADRPQGEWIFVESKISDRKLKKCSVCGLGYVSLKPDNYCPHCGAKMVNGEGGE